MPSTSLQCFVPPVVPCTPLQCFVPPLNALYPLHVLYPPPFVSGVIPECVAKWLSGRAVPPHMLCQPGDDSTPPHPTPGGGATQQGGGGRGADRLPHS